MRQVEEEFTSDRRESDLMFFSEHGLNLAWLKQMSPVNWFLIFSIKHEVSPLCAHSARWFRAIPSFLHLPRHRENRVQPLQDSSFLISWFFLSLVMPLGCWSSHPCLHFSSCWMNDLSLYPHGMKVLIYLCKTESWHYIPHVMLIHNLRKIFSFLIV